MYPIPVQSNLWVLGTLEFPACLQGLGISCPSVFPRVVQAPVSCAHRPNGWLWRQVDGDWMRRPGPRCGNRRRAPRPAALPLAEQVVIAELGEGLVAGLSALAAATQNPSSKGSPCPGAGEVWPSPFT